MPRPAPDRDRIVVVAAGFAHYVAGRSLAAFRWTDVVRVDATCTSASTLALHVDMADGGTIELQETVTGFDLFLDRAAVVLHGLAPFSSWHPALAAAAEGARVTIFERPPRRQ